MRKLLPLLAVTVLTGVSLAIAAEVKTVTGEAVCAKCALSEQAKCQNVITAEEGGKKVKYYLTGAESKKAHGAMGICTAKEGSGPKIKATGDVTEKDGKQVMDVTKIEKSE